MSNRRCHPGKHALDELLARCEGAYSDLTLRGYRSDLEAFKCWCEQSGQSWLPATPDAVAGFINYEAPSKSIATLKRRISAIQFAHRIADQSSPVNHSEVQLALRRASRAKRSRPKQSLGLTSEMLKRIVEACPDTLDGRRDAALLCVGYDTLCRSCELVAMQVEHLSDDYGSVEVPRAKSDPFGNGRIAYLSPQTAARLKAWLDGARICSGSLFRGLHTGVVSDNALDTSSVRRRIKAAAIRARLDSKVVLGLSGHSMRVGAAQDMMLSGFDALGIMQAGGWRTYSVVSRYVEHAAAANMHLRRWERAGGSGR